MSREITLQTRSTLQAERPSDLPSVPLLIQVPELRAPRARVARPRPRPTGEPRRRRLRREVRVTCYAVLTAMPLVIVSALMAWGRPSTLFGSIAPVAVEAVAASDGCDAPQAPVIQIVIDPTVLIPATEADSPVEFPGYLLPDDGPEEPRHAGS